MTSPTGQDPSKTRTRQHESRRGKATEQSFVRPIERNFWHSRSSHAVELQPPEARIAQS